MAKRACFESRQWCRDGGHGNCFVIRDVGSRGPDASKLDSMAFFQPQQTRAAAESNQSAVPPLQPWVER